MAFLKTNGAWVYFWGNWSSQSTGAYLNSMYDLAFRFSGPVVADSVIFEFYSRIASNNVNFTYYVNNQLAVGGQSAQATKNVGAWTAVQLTLTSSQVAALNTSTPYIILQSGGVSLDVSYLGDSNDPALNYSSAADQPASGCKAWTGSKFADHLVKCWTGSKWEDQLVRFWNGSAWKDGN